MESCHLNRAHHPLHLLSLAHNHPLNYNLTEAGEELHLEMVGVEVGGVGELPSKQLLLLPLFLLSLAHIRHLNYN